jgi:hypothetical protein
MFIKLLLVFIFKLKFITNLLKIYYLKVAIRILLIFIKDKFNLIVFIRFLLNLFFKNSFNKPY